jgi:ribosome biogenesis GTPase
VLRVERGLATLLTEEGEQRAGYGGQLLCRVANDPCSAPCVGDWAVIRDWPDRRFTVERVVPRRTSLVRAIGGRCVHEPVLAANVDLAGIVVDADTAPSIRLQPFLAMAQLSGATPVLVLTRCDLVPAPAAVVAAVDPEGRCRAVLTSATTGEGLHALRELLEHHLTLALIGPPAEGRSSLVRGLVGELAVRRAVPRELHVLPDGGAVIDIPALRAVA